MEFFFLEERLVNDRKGVMASPIFVIKGYPD
jgi:hypothetical protein